MTKRPSGRGGKPSGKGQGGGGGDRRDRAKPQGGNARPQKRYPTRRHDQGRSQAPHKTVTGTLRAERDGTVWLVPDDTTRERVLVPPHGMGTAKAGQHCTVALEPGRKGRLRGKVVPASQVRTPTKLVGTLRQQGHDWLVFVEPDNRAFVIHPEELGGARQGELVLLKAHGAKDSRDARGRPSASIVEVFGSAHEPTALIAALVAQQDWPLEFSDEVMNEVAAMPDVDPERALKDGRKDLRGVMHVTIDGGDARDFDDAVSAAPESDGYRVWVSIADVAHYVRPKTQLDTEALARATSVYFPHRVLPMLPERLSNGLCSLKPNEPRHTLTCEMHVHADGRMSDVSVYPSLIQSAARLTYEQVQATLDGGVELPIPVRALIRELAPAARILRAARKRRGAVDLDIPEAKVVVDERGLPIELRQRPRLEAHQLIEDLMVAANECVAEHLLEKDWPGVYRVHEPPDPLRLATVAKWAKRLGHKLDVEAAREPKALQRFVEGIKHETSAPVIHTLVLRSLAQARYQDSNVGHYGLASRAYLHFTSPIRRYPDLLVHRALWGAWRSARFPSQLDALAQHCSQQERKAMEAERAVVQLMGCLLAQDHVGETMTARVTGISRAGAFVRPTTLFVDGLVPIEAFGARTREYYEVLEDEQALVAQRSGHAVRLGDEVEVLLASVDLKKRYINFTLPEPRRAQAGTSRAAGFMTPQEALAGEPRPTSTSVDANDRLARFRERQRAQGEDARPSPRWRGTKRPKRKK